MKAQIELGFFNEWYEGETVDEILFKVEQDQDFGCLLRMGRSREDEKGLGELKKLEDFLEKYYSGSLTVDDLKTLNIHLSIGNIICHEVLE